ncbi:hypothetical protein LTR78_004687 [Recurvomyces mirabilis]|uniref:Uncharacterized protein n=2 Tax=Recurvomyces mirabilis TaxID=574656 RepID=A0AAE0WPQ0_9PEZI|nr:hypothetical protein LTR78_004687 [Recurvomyces mirabilis]
MTVGLCCVSSLLNNELQDGMRTTSTTTASLLAFAVSAHATSYEINNYCTYNVSLTLSNATATEPALTLNSGLAFITDIVGKGNSVGITKEPGDYWDANGKKGIFGTSTVDGTLWWDLATGNSNGGPLDPQSINVTSSGPKADSCGHVTDYSGGVKNCPDDGHVALVVNLCSNN